MANKAFTLLFSGTTGAAFNWVASGANGAGIAQTLPYLDGRVAVYDSSATRTRKWNFGTNVLITDVQITGYDAGGDPIVALTGDTIANLAPPLTFEDGFGAQETGASGSFKNVSLTSQNSVFSFFRPKPFTIQNCIVDFAYDDKEKAFQIRKGSVEFKPAAFGAFYIGESTILYLVSTEWGDPNGGSIPQNVPANSIGFHNINRITHENFSNLTMFYIVCYPNIATGDQTITIPGYNRASIWLGYASSVPTLACNALDSYSTFGTKTVADALASAAQIATLMQCGNAYCALVYPTAN